MSTRMSVKRGSAIAGSLMLLASLYACGSGDDASPTAASTTTPRPTPAPATSDAISLATITPAADTVLRRGESVTLTAIVDYTLASADGGVIALVTQSFEGPMLERARLRIGRGTGRLTIAGSITVPALASMRVFVLLLPDGANGTSTIAVLDYRIE